MRIVPLKYSLAAGLLGICAGAAALSPLRIPYCISVSGKVVPLREWILTRDPEGLISTVEYNHVTGVAETSESSPAERGDQASFRFHPKALSAGSLAAGDTIAFSWSSNIEFLHAQLRGELETEKATLALYETGEKESLVREARLQMEYARKQAEQQRREIARLKALAVKSMIPEADMERAETALQLYEIQSHTAEAHLHSLETGSKKEQMDFVRVRIAALERQVAVVDKRLRLSTITTPIPGRLLRFSGSDTLAIVQDTSRYVVVLPVKWKERGYLCPGRRVQVGAEGMALQPRGEIEHLGENVFILNGSQIIRIAAIMDKDARTLAPGLIVRCRISCPPVRLHEFILRYLGQ